MRVLVTGAFGRLGLKGIERLLKEGHSVIAFDVSNRRNRKAARRFEERIRVLWGDKRMS
jgi:nucleoside-diphosphate-sugar epimerase